MPRQTLHFVEDEWNGKKRWFRKGVVVAAFIPAGPSPTDKEEKMNEIVDSVHGATIDTFSLSGNWVALRLAEDNDNVIHIAEDLAARADVRYTQPDFLVVSAAASEPDPEDIDLWWVGDVRAEDAWKIESGRDHVLIGVIDSGIALVEVLDELQVNHDDLDPDQFVLGPDYTEDGADAEVFMPIDEHGHGTAVAGIIAARRDTDEGVKGMNNGSPVCVVRVLKKSSGWDPGTADGSDTALRHALEYLVGLLDDDANLERLVINVSAVMPDVKEDGDAHLVSEYFYDTLVDDERVIVCASAGNDGDDVPLYPAAYAANTRVPATVTRVFAA